MRLDEYESAEWGSLVYVMYEDVIRAFAMYAESTILE